MGAEMLSFSSTVHFENEAAHIVLEDANQVKV